MNDALLRYSISRAREGRYRCSFSWYRPLEKPINDYAFVLAHSISGVNLVPRLWGRCQLTKVEKFRVTFFVMEMILSRYFQAGKALTVSQAQTRKRQHWFIITTLLWQRSIPALNNVTFSRKSISETDVVRVFYAYAAQHKAPFTQAISHTKRGLLYPAVYPSRGLERKLSHITWGHSSIQFMRTWRGFGAVTRRKTRAG